MEKTVTLLTKVTLILVIFGQLLTNIHGNTHTMFENGMIGEFNGLRDHIIDTISDSYCPNRTKLDKEALENELRSCIDPIISSLKNQTDDKDSSNSGKNKLQETISIFGGFIHGKNSEAAKALNDGFKNFIQKNTHKYCTAVQHVLNCVEPKKLNSIETCLNEDTMDVINLYVSYIESFTGSLCENDGENMMALIDSATLGTYDCFKAYKNHINNCFKSLDFLDSYLMSNKTLREACSDLKNAQDCLFDSENVNGTCEESVVNGFNKMIQPRLANFVQGPCTKRDRSARDSSSNDDDKSGSVELYKVSPGLIMMFLSFTFL